MREILKYILVLKYRRNIVILEKGVFGKRVLLIEKSTFHYGYEGYKNSK